MKTLVLLALISMMGAIPIKHDHEQHNAKAFKDLVSEVERPEPAYRIRRQSEEDDTQMEFTVPYCPEGFTLSGTSFEILKKTIVDAVEPSCPETLVGDACKDYNSEFRKCVVTRIPDFITKIKKHKFNLSEEEKNLLSQMSVIVAQHAMALNQHHMS